MLGRPSNMDNSRARAYCACRMCGWELFGLFPLVYQCSFLSPRRTLLWEMARYKLKKRLRGPLNPKQTTGQVVQVSGPLFKLILLWPLYPLGRTHGAPYRGYGYVPVGGTSLGEWEHNNFISRESCLKPSGPSCSKHC